MTTHKVIFSKAQSIKKVKNSTVDLIVTSPPYPMIEMWDEIFFKQNNKIKSALNSNNPEKSFELMHQELDKVWRECSRTLKEGGIACINIGDATRTIDKNFRLFANHSRIIQGFIKLGFQNLPNIIWRKQTNAPNKFMGSGMLPPGAYVTLEHEFILIFRKNRKREFKKIEEKDNRHNSSYFWEERNEWFSDLWNLKGTTQKMKSKETRERSAAYPFELSYRLVNMFSVQGDTVLDPFLGTGTTTLSAMASNRNSIGIEIDKKFKKTIIETMLGKEDFLNNRINERLKKHLLFVDDRIKSKGKDTFKYVNKSYDFPVLTRQELKIKIPFVKSISKIDEKSEFSFQVDYIN
ncbi:MAG TPA: site-specific DNA-methyltransferase [Flavobacteriaceae bacterium]|jgi:DNA modification methylase|nr:site-specific DNA-methyltransferase [Flavobacteriaceae bacterium]